MKWLVSSRNIDEIENLLEIDGSASEVKLSLEVTQNAEQISRAIDTFIDFKLSSIRCLRDDCNTRSRVREVMREKADGTFLWVALVVKELKKAKSWRVLQVVEKIPATLEAFYDLMMDRARQSDEGEWEFCQLVLSATTLVYRPLHLAELAIVSGLPPNISAHTNRVREVIALCGSFLTVKESVVYLIHQSVKDYLSGRAADIVFPTGLGEAHRAIFARSVQALSSGILRRNMYGLPHIGIPIDDIKVPTPDPLAGIRYSCIHWARHFCDVLHGNSGIENDDLERIDQFIRSFSLYWLEAVALLRSISECIISIRQLETFLKVRARKFTFILY
jgi:hypothetical protein